MWSHLRRLWRLFDGETQRQIRILAVLIILGGLLEGLGIGALFPLLRVVADPADLETLPVLGPLYQMMGHPSHLLFIAGLCAATFAAFAIKNAATALVTRYQYRFVWINRSRVAVQLLRYYLNSPYELHLRRNSAVLTRNIATSVHEIFAGTVLPAVQLLTEAAVAMVIAGLLVLIDPVTATLAVLLIGLPSVLVYRLTRRRLSICGKQVNDTNAAILLELAHALGGIKEIKAAGCEKAFVTSFQTVMACNSTMREESQTITQYPRLIIETLTVAVVLGGLGVLVASGRPFSESIAVLGVFGVAAARLMPSFTRIAGYAGNLRLGSATLDTIEADIVAARQDLPPPAAASLLLTRDIRVENLSFRYGSRDKDVLSAIGMTVKAGSSVALVGPSGSGKTTLADLMLGLLEPTAGHILVDGVPLSAENGPAWRRRIGYIAQNAFLLDASLAENIAFGLPLDQERLNEVIRQAQLEEVVAALPQGMQTSVGDRGVLLSGGQRQRVGIARALYRDADLLLLDEATSALDAETESRIGAVIETLRGTKTIIIIAHRLSTVRHCDVVHLLSNQRLVDSGSFTELSARNDEFRRMVQEMSLTVGHGEEQ